MIDESFIPTKRRSRRASFQGDGRFIMYFQMTMRLEFLVMDK